MVGKIAAAMVCAFWAIMMVALVRMEYLGELGGTEVPAELVLSKIFSQETPARLNVLHEGRVIGFCKVDIERPPLTRSATVGTNRTAALPTICYQAHTELTLALGNFGIPSRLWVVGNTQFDQDFAIRSYQILTTLGDGHLELQGDEATHKLLVDFSIGAYHDHRVIDYQQLRGDGLQSLMGFANMGMFGAAGLAQVLPQFGGGIDMAAGKRLMSVRTSELQIAGEAEETYLIEIRLDQSLWARIWISKQGEVLKVDTSAHLVMLADTLTDLQNRYQDETEYDPH